jgi:AmiR/NasT family two-component response regulator
MDLAIARFRETRALAERLDERKVIERAKGALMPAIA